MIKQTFILILAVLIYSCTGVPEQEEKGTQRIEAFEKVLSSTKLKGTILVYDTEKSDYYSNDYTWAERGYLPASTFKITNSIIALETGVVTDGTTLFKWNGEDRMLDVWEQDLTLKAAFHASCVPCFQEVARNIGARQMNQYLTKLAYGTMDVDSTNIDLFWLRGGSRITPFEQIDFLRRFYTSALPISKRTEEIMKKMIVIEENEDYKLSGKTGWSIANGQDNGWFVGYVETKNTTYFFATNLEPDTGFDRSGFANARKTVTYQAFQELGVNIGK